MKLGACLKMCLPVAMLASAAAAQTPATIDITQAKALFAETKDISDHEGGRLWGMKLYGAMFFVDPQTRYVVANEPDLQGVLKPQDGVYVGTLPKGVLISNAPIEWGGKRWTELMWPMYGDAVSRRVSLGHEPFHRIQPQLHLMAEDFQNPELDTEDGRLWLQLEWRALAAALIEKGPAQTQAIRDAILFRDQRHHEFPGSAKTEASLEIAEGVPEYTGVVATLDHDSGLWRTIAKLADPDQTMTFVRSFAYTSGPAYGLLLDERLPNWRKGLNEKSDLGALLASTVHGGPQESAEKRAAVYGVAALRMTEDERAAKAAAEKAKYRALLIDGPTLTLASAGHFAFNFNPSTLVGMGDVGSVYPTFYVKDSWGTLDVKGGALVPSDFSGVTVAAPATPPTGSHVAGPGWTLDLAPGWKIVPGAKPGSYVVQKG